MINELFKDLSNIPAVSAIALGGSRAGTNYDEISDYDVYLYINEPIDINIRRHILSKYCKVLELGNSFWEYEDNCVLNNDIDIDILYRNLADFTSGLEYVVEKHHSYNGYTTCMWHNLINCKIIYDKDGKLQQAKDRFNITYPKELKENIINRNIQLLSDALPAYSLQILKAIKRKDMVSINHRVSAFLESYFDIIFAVNELTHPGEKRLISLCKQNCKILPKDFEYNLDELFKNMFIDFNKTIDILENIVKEIKEII